MRKLGFKGLEYIGVNWSLRKDIKHWVKNASKPVKIYTKEEIKELEKLRCK